jgi:excinuclease ABC subunit C
MFRQGEGQVAALPDQHGVYLMRNPGGKIIYVGSRRPLRSRVSSISPQHLFQGRSQAARLIRTSMTWISCRSNRGRSLLTESRLIKILRPRYNVSLKDDKRFLLLR